MFAPPAAAGRGRHEEEDGQPDVPENEPGEAASEGHHEAPEPDPHQEHSMHSLEYNL